MLRFVEVGLLESNSLPSKVLFVDDDTAFAEHVSKQLEKHKVRVVRASALETAQYYFNAQKFDLAIVELEFGELPGLGLIQKWLAHPIEDKRKTGFVIASGKGRTREEENLIREVGGFEIVNKPLATPGLLNAMQKTRSKLDKEKELDILEKKVKRLSGTAAGFREAEELLKTLQYQNDFGQRPLEILCSLYCDQNDYPKAVELADAQLKREPENLRFMNIKAGALLKMNHLNEAAYLYEHADKVAPMNLNRLASMAALYMELKDPYSARVKYQSLVRFADNKKDFIAQTADQFVQRGFDEDAKKFIMDNDSVKDVISFYNNRGVLLAKTKKYSQAKEEYHKALRLFAKYKESHKLYYNIALSTYKQGGDKAEGMALDYLKKALELDSKYQKAIDLMSTIRKR